MSRIILRYRVVFLIALLAATAFMGYHAKDVQMSYQLAQLIPSTNPKYQEYQRYKSLFGEDANLLIIGTQTDRLFELDFFNDWYDLGEEMKAHHGIEEVISVAHLYNLEKSSENKQFIFTPLVEQKPETQEALDSLRTQIGNLPFYKNRLYNDSSGATLMALTFDQEVLNSPQRNEVVEDIREHAEAFSRKHDTELYYSGLPLIRSVLSTKIRVELIYFTLLAMLVTAVILFILFRSIYTVVAPMIVVMISVIWSLGIVGGLQYEITLLTGIIPPLIVVIGIPNCIYLLNRYHSEFKKHGSKIKGLSRVIEKVGMATFITNLTTAIGFGVFFFTGSEILKEFGLVSFLSIMSTFVISLIFIPGVFSFMPNPGPVQTKYLENNIMQGWLRFIGTWITGYRPVVYAIAMLVIGTAAFGLIQIKATGYIVDDLPQDAKAYKDLAFFEAHFNGIMPFEIIVDTRRKGGATQLSTIRQIDRIQDVLLEYPEFSRPLSIAEGMKFITQAYFNGDPKRYRLPNNMEKNFILPYLTKVEGQEQLIQNFLDTNKQVTKISLQMKDVGSSRLPELLADLQTRVYDKVDTSRMDLAFTGTSVIFLEGNRYLIQSLIYSLAIAFLLIASIMGFLFRSVRMLFICLVPNTIPLIITAGIMGYFEIPLKPSTVLIFSVAFGISVDTSIHFLAKYQQEIRRHNWTISRAVFIALHETGRSMIYNSLILFFGFVIFSASSFGGTVALGVLTSITLVVAMFTNTVLLPAFLLTMEDNILKRNGNSPVPAMSIYESRNNYPTENGSEKTGQKEEVRNAQS